MCKSQWHHLRGTCTNQSSVNSLAVSTQYQLVLNGIKLVLSSKPWSVKKSPFQVTLHEKWCFGCLWFRSLRFRINVHWSRIKVHLSLLWHIKLAEAEQLLGLPTQFKSSFKWKGLFNFKLYYNRQERYRQKMIHVIPSHFNNLKRNWQKPLFL